MSLPLNVSTGHNSLGDFSLAGFVRQSRLPMLFALTRQEKRIIAVLALLIVLGSVGMAVL